MSIFERPEFYDIFGVFIFTFIIIISIWTLTTNENLPQWILRTLLIIGILGLIIDGTIVYKKFLS